MTWLISYPLWVMNLTARMATDGQTYEQMESGNPIHVSCKGKASANMSYLMNYKPRSWKYKALRATVFDIWATSWENLFMPYVNNKGTDQPALISSAEQAGLSLTWLLIPKTGFLMTRLIFQNWKFQLINLGTSIKALISPKTRFHSIWSSGSYVPV